MDAVLMQFNMACTRHITLRPPHFSLSNHPNIGCCSLQIPRQLKTFLLLASYLSLSILP